MRKLYGFLAIVGGLVPPAIFFVANFDRRDPDAIIDLGLVFYSFGITILAIPIGIAGGLAVAGLAHMAWNRVSPGKPRSTFARQRVSLLADPNSTSRKADDE